MHTLLNKLIDALDYTLDKSDSEEVIPEDENPDGMFNGKYLTDTVPLTLLEFSTLQDLKELREVLKKARDA